MIDRQSFVLTLPDGSTVKPSSGTVTLDDTWTPYVQATIVIPKPASVALLDPRTTRRVTLTLLDEFADSPHVSDLTVAYGALTVAQLTTLWTSKNVSDLTVTWGGIDWNDGAAIQPVSRVIQGALESYTYTKNGDLQLVIQSDEQFLLDQVSDGTVSIGPGIGTLRDLVIATLGTSDLQGSAEYDLTPVFAAGGGSITQAAGTTDWEFLDTYVQLAGARLWCDELSKWHLDWAPNVKPGLLALDAATNITDYSVGITRAGSWYDCVIVNYIWTVAGVAHNQTDEAGVFGFGHRAYYVERQQPYPGAGAAAAILARVSLQGATADPVAVNDFTAQPGEACTVTTAAAGTLTGAVQSVAWDIAAATMTVTPRNLA